MLELGRGAWAEAVGARVAAVGAELGFNTALLQRVLELRSQHARDGNRRRLFAALDELLCADLPPWAPAGGDIPAGAVRLRRLMLRNWKVFDSAELVFPEYAAARPVVLIGGKNGYGKTSLLEALLFGLFGAGAIETLQPDGGSSLAQRQAAYRAFIERALHRPARERGDGSATVRSEWDTPEGIIVVERRWYFDEEVRFVPEDETVTVWCGADSRPLPPPPEAEPGLFYQQEIERRLLPASLAAFVFFDGEQMKRFAERRHSEQVRLAAEAVMGLGAWREAAADLKAYARDRGRVASKDDANIESLAAELLKLEAEDAELAARLEAIEARAAEPRAARDAALAALAAVDGGTYANLHDLLERQQALGQDLGRARHELATALSAAAPLGLIPLAQRTALASGLRAELAGDQPWRELFGDEAARAAFLKSLGEELGRDGAEPALAAARRAWEKLAVSPPHDAPHRHTYLGNLRGRLAQLLEAGADLPRITAALDRLGSLQAELAAIAAELAQHQRRDAEASEARARLAEVNTILAKLEGEARGARETRDAASGRLETLRAQTLAAVKPADDSGADRHQRALGAALAIERIIDAVRPLCFEALGARVTAAYCALAHKRLVDRVSIAPDGEVSLLDAQGSNVLGIEASAGESQVFAMALVAAVGELAPRHLPVIIDTPLGRLDPDHRERILAYFTGRPVQTVLLSQPDEVNGRYLAMIEHRVAARFRLDHAAAEAGGPGGSVPTPNAYPELAA